MVSKQSSFHSNLMKSTRKIIRFASWSSFPKDFHEGFHPDRTMPLISNWIVSESASLEDFHRVCILTQFSRFFHHGHQVCILIVFPRWPRLFFLNLHFYQVFFWRYQNDWVFTEVLDQFQSHTLESTRKIPKKNQFWAPLARHSKWIPTEKTVQYVQLTKCMPR